MDVVQGLNVEIGAHLDPLLKAVRGIESAFRPIGNKLQGIGQTLSTSITAPLVVAGAAAGKTAIDFETAFTGVLKTVDGTTEEIAGLRDGILAMTKVLPASANEIAGVAESAGQLGIETSNVLEFTRTMIDLGETTNLSASQAATAFARFDNITGGTQQNFARLGSTIVALGNNLATTEAEISEMSLRLAGAGNTAGLSQANILGLAGALSSLGISAEAGGTAFSRVIIDIASAVKSGGTELEKFAAVAGQSTAEFSKSFKEDAAGALTQFVAGLGKIDKSGGNVFAVLEELGLAEVRVRDALLRAAGAGDLLSRSLDIAGRSFQENTALATEAAQRYKTVQSSLDLVKNAVTRLAVAIGDAGLLDVIQNLSKRFVELIDRIAELPAGVLRMGTALAAAAAAVGPLLFVLGKVVSFIPVILKGFTAFTGPVGIAAIAIAGAAVLIIRNWEAVREFFSNVLPGAGAGLVGVFQSMRSAASIAISRIKVAIGDLVATIAPLFQGALSRVQKFWAAWGETILSITGTVFSTATTLLGGAFEGFIQFLDIFINLFTGNWEGFLKSLGRFAGTVLKQIASVFIGFFEIILTGLAKTASFINKDFGKAIEFARDKVKELRGFVAGLGAEEINTEGPAELTSEIEKTTASTQDLKAELASIDPADVFTGLTEGARSTVGEVDRLRAKIADLFSGETITKLNNQFGELFTKRKLNTGVESGPVVSPEVDTSTLPDLGETLPGLQEINAAQAESNRLTAEGVSGYDRYKVAITEAIGTAVEHFPALANVFGIIRQSLDQLLTVFADGLAEAIVRGKSLTEVFKGFKDELRQIGKQLLSKGFRLLLGAGLNALVPGLGAFAGGGLAAGIGGVIGSSGFSGGRSDIPSPGARDQSVRFDAISLGNGVLLQANDRAQRSNQISFGS